jgi:hypothetical protein
VKGGNSVSERTTYDAWRSWTLNEVAEETERILRAAEYSPNASYSPMVIHYYREGFLMELRHRDTVFATTWLSEHPSKEALCQWAVETATAFVKSRKEQKRQLLQKRARSAAEARRTGAEGADAKDA